MAQSKEADRVTAILVSPGVDDLERGGENIQQNSPLDPTAWSERKKMFVVFVGLLTLFNSVFDSTIPSGGIRSICDFFSIKSEAQQVLPTSVYLIGYVMGPLVFGPMSEVYGRRVVMVGTFILFTIFTLACALSPNWAGFLIFRTIVGICASCPIAVTGGLFSDVYQTPLVRGRMMALSMAVTTAGPQFAPMISGYLAQVGWRWIFWVSLILAAVTLGPVLYLPETFAPILKQTNRLKKRDEGFLVKAFTRPVYMIFYEPIISLTCLYLSYASAIFSGLAFLPIAVGAAIGLIIFLWYDSFLYRAKSQNAEWAFIEEYQRLPLACLGGPLYVLALFWLGWTASVEIHWIVPMLAGIPFGMGFFLIFVALINYLIDAYHKYAASAMAAASTCRSIFGAVLPLAASPMFYSLGVNWGTSLLAFLSLVMTFIPFVFIRYGEAIRRRSSFRQELQKE
ncbi:unnamed protein product [Penicillium pancosmium]